MGGAFVAGEGQHRLEGDVARDLNDPARRSRTDDTSWRIDLRIDLGISPDGRGSIGLEERGRFDRISGEPLTRSGPWRERQQDGGEHRHDGDDGDHFKEGEPRDRARPSHIDPFFGDMAGLSRPSKAFQPKACKKDMDARDKPGHEAREVIPSRRNRAQPVATSGRHSTLAVDISAAVPVPPSCPSAPYDTIS